MKNYEELTFSDDFMFCKILQDNEDLCKELTELVLGRKIGRIVKSQSQKAIQITADGHGVRFDLFNMGYHRYTFIPKCKEVENLELKDKTSRIFICSGGNRNDVSDEMKQFIDYLSGKTASSNLAARLEEKVKEAIEQRFWRKEYMTLKEMMKDEFENGFDTCLINLICKKLIKGKSEEAIADELEEDLEKVKQICEIAYKYAPDYDSEKILEELKICKMS